MDPFKSTLAEAPQDHRFRETFLKNCPREIFDQFRICELRSGEILYFQGKPPEKVSVLLEGNLKSYRCNPLGAKYFILIHYPGELLGEIEILEEKPCSASVEAIRDSTVLQMPRPAYMQWLQQDMQFNMYVHKLLCAKHYQLIQKSAEDNLYPLKYRFISLLCYLSNEDGGNRPVRGAVMEETLGITLASMKRLLQEWADQGIIAYQKGEIRVLEMERLKKEMWLSF